ncbi:MAG: hypothetical protein GY816_08255 [Cytophagales bacterium]|nr:hypothetical protein [Cytophagales bacterium]
MKHIILISLLLVATISQAQPGWNWPEDEKMYDMAQEKQAYYKVLMGQDKYVQALEQLKWLYSNNPNLNPSIYIDGTKCLETIIKSTEDMARINVLQDSALWMFDARIVHFGNEASVLDRKAYTAFKYHYKTASRYPLLIELFDKAYELNGAGISNFNLTPYMLITKYSYERKLDEMPREKVLDIHSTISNILDLKEKAGVDMTDTRNKIDAFLSSIEGLLDCQYIESQLVPRLEANQDDLNIAKKIFSYSLQAKCSDQPYFMMAAETISRNEPSFALAKVLGDKWYNRGDYTKAMAQFTSATELAENNQDVFDALMGQAKSASKLGKKSQARSFARRALEKKSGAKEAYDLIGNLYFSSSAECNEGESRVLDRANFIAAHAMYKKSGNTSQMAASQSQFPSISEIFEEGYEEGDVIAVGCWINETVKLQRRPTTN